MEKGILRRLDRLITKHELALSELGARKEIVSPDLIKEVDRLEKSLYALCEGVRGFLRAKEYGFPLDRFDRYLESVETVTNQIEQSMSRHLSQLHSYLEQRGRG
jgi:hypothetical protein